MVEPDSQAEVIRSLAGRLRRLERARPPVPVEDHCVSTGLAALDAWLPGGGMTPGLVIEWLAADDGLGSTTLALSLMRQALAAQGVAPVDVPQVEESEHSADASEATETGRGRSDDRCGALQAPVLVVVDSRGMFYAPEAVRLGIAVEHLLVVRPNAAEDVLWSWEQSLRSTGVVASVCWLERISGLVYRRIKLAAETGGGIHHVIRPASHSRDPSWADLRLLVDAVQDTCGDRGRPFGSRTARVELVYGRGVGAGECFECEI